MRKTFQKFNAWIAWTGVRNTVGLLRILPFGVARALSVGVARLVFYLDRKHREIALANLRVAFPNEDDAWRWRVARGSFDNYGHMAVEVANLHLWTPENIRDYVTFEGYENYEKAKEKGRGCFYMTAHFGNWELAGQIQPLFGHVGHAVVRPLDNPYLDDYLARMRTSNGTRIIDKKHGGLKAMIAALRRNEDVAILVDQYSRRSKGVFVPLFGVLASTTAGVSVMALRTRTPIVPAFTVREPGKMRFRAFVLPEIDLPDTGNRKEDIRLTTARINEALEQMIRIRPDHWLWGHRRWKKSPDIEGNIYRGGRLLRREGKPVSGKAGRDGREGFQDRKGASPVMRSSRRKGRAGSPAAFGNEEGDGSRARRLSRRGKSPEGPGSGSAMKIGMWLSYVLVRINHFLLRNLPFRAACAVALGMSRLAYCFDKRHRNIALTNLRLAFPEKDEAWRRRVARQSFENYGRIAVEVAHLHRWTAANIRDHVTFENYERYEKAKERLRGCFYVTAHFGNWELLAHAHALVGRPFNAVVRPLDNPVLDAYVESMRTSTGNRIIDKKHGGAKAIMGALRKNEDIGILIDQYSRRSKGVFVPFFGVAASTTIGLSVMALRTRAPLVPVFMVREPGEMRFRVLIFPEIALPDTGDQKEDIRLTTARINQALEEVIRIQPDHWLWVHRRWKKSPDIEGNLYRGGSVIRLDGRPVPPFQEGAA